MPAKRTSAGTGRRLVGVLSLALVALFLWNRISVPFHLASHDHGGLAHGHGHGHSHDRDAPADSRDLLAAWLAGEAPDSDGPAESTPGDSERRDDRPDDDHAPHSALDHIAELFAFAASVKPAVVSGRAPETEIRFADAVRALVDADAVCAASRGPPAQIA